jgi:long-chain acyl-CoA synthetase
VPAGDPGEIWVRGANVFHGYWNDPEATGRVLTADGWLRTGDKGALDDDGNLRIVGRVKDLFKTSKGKYVTPAPIEDQLVTHSAVEACCVTGANLGQPVALLMLNAGATQRSTVEAERLALEKSLAEHLQRINALLDPHEQLDCLVLITDAWTVDNDLHPRRNAVSIHGRALFVSIYILGSLLFRVASRSYSLRSAIGIQPRPMRVSHG